MLSGELMLPIFTNAEAKEIVWSSYATVAIIRHHGVSPHSGRDTAMVEGNQDLTLDEDAEPKKQTPRRWNPPPLQCTCSSSKSKSPDVGRLLHFYVHAHRMPSLAHVA